MLYSKGFLEDMPFSSIYALLAFTKTSGVLILEEEHLAITTKLYFKDGIVTFASTDDIELRLSALLLKNNQLDINTLRATEKYITPDKKHGQILLENGHLTKDELYNGLKDQIKEIILNVFEWHTGKFLFTQLDKEEVGLFDIEFEFPMHHLLILGIMRINSFHRLMGIFGGIDARYVRKNKVSFFLPEKIIQKYEDILNCFNLPTTILEASRKITSIKPMIFLRNVLVLLTFGLIEPDNKIALKDRDEGLSKVLTGYNELFRLISSELIAISKDIMIRLEMESLVENTKKQFPFFRSKIGFDDDFNLTSGFLSEIELLPIDQQKEILYMFLHTCFESILNVYRNQIDQTKYIEIVENLKKRLDRLKLNE